MTSTLRWTSSAASSGSRSVRPSLDRYSNATSREYGAKDCLTMSWSDAETRPESSHPTRYRLAGTSVADVAADWTLRGALSAVPGGGDTAGGVAFAMDDGTSVLMPGEAGSAAGTTRASPAGTFCVGVLSTTASDRGGVGFVADRDTTAGAAGLAADSARVAVAEALTEDFES